MTAGLCSQHFETGEVNAPLKFGQYLEKSDDPVDPATARSTSK
jgi:hypothetical protein